MVDAAGNDLICCLCDAVLLVMNNQLPLIEFLKEELSLSTEAIALGLRQSKAAPNLLPIVLWQYGLVTIHQLSQIYDWLEGTV